MGLFSAIASAFGGLVSSAGQIYSNQQNIKQQRANNALAVDLANTAHQREVADLKAAGLNPILSASGAGSEVPSLGVATQINPATGIADGINSAASLFTPEKRATVENIKANTEKAKADADAVAESSSASMLNAKSQAILAHQELQNKQLQEDILQDEKSVSHFTSLNKQLKEAAYYEALSGRSSTSFSALHINPANRKTYDDLVQYYRNQIEKQRYTEAVEREYIRDGIKSAKDITEIGTGIKKINKPAKKGKRR